MENRSPPCHPEAFWAMGSQIDADSWLAVCSVCGRTLEQASSPEVASPTASAPTKAD